jgi:hypothetical protein
MTAISKKVEQLESQLEAAKQALKDENRRKKFKCGCGKMHEIGKCSVVQRHWYERPWGCTGGDNWWQGELQIVCPDTGLRNRLLYDVPWDVPYDKKNSFEYNPDLQFKNGWKYLFKEVIDEYEENTPGEWCNNYYVDKNHEKFGIKVKYKK